MILSAAVLLAISPTVQSTQRRPKPLHPLPALFSDSDYPVDALIRHAEGRTKFELFIDDKGLPYACRILETAKEPSLDRVTCDLLMARARFEPALNAQGVAVPDSLVGAIVWRLPDKASELMPFKSTRRVMRIYPGTAGVSHCELTEDGHAWPRLTRDQCLPLASREAIDFAESHELTVPLTIVDTFKPDGRKGEEHGQAYGTIATEMTIALRIGADGKVIFCQPISFQPLPDLQWQSVRQPDLCKDLEVEGWKFEPIADHTVVRSGRFTTRVYFGQDPAQAKLSREAR